MDDYERKRKERERLSKRIMEAIRPYKKRKRLYPKMLLAHNRFAGSKTITRKLYKELANLTAKINFRCNFKNGTCRSGRSTERCCCSDCRESFGYLDTIFFAVYSSDETILEEILYYIKKFSTITGFWRKDKGCILPRSRRSTTCLTYNCSDERFSDEEKLLITSIRNFKNTDMYLLKQIRNILINYFLYRDD